MKTRNKVLSILLMFVMVMAIPVLGNVSKAYAGGDVDYTGLFQGANSDGTVYAGKTVSVSVSALDDLYGGPNAFFSEWQYDKVGAYFVVGGTEITAKFDGDDSFYYETTTADIGKEIYFLTMTKIGNTGWNNNTYPKYTIVADPSASSGGETPSTPSTPSGGETPSTPSTPSGGETPSTPSTPSGSETPSGGETPSGSETPAAETSLDIKIDSKGIATITGTTTGSADFKGVYTENYEGNRWIIDDNLSGKSFSVTFDTKKLNIGYHPLYAVMTDDTEVYYPKVFPTAIYDKPSLKASYFETNNKTITFSVPNHNGATYDYYLQMKGAKSDWSDASLIGPLAPNDKVKLGIKNIKAGKKYTFRPVYVKETTYGGNKYYFFSTTVSTPKAVTIKTGPKAKPAVKSVTISKGKQHKVWVKPLYKGIILVHEGYWVWETDYTVTVKFKKKPGIVGLYIHGTGNTPLYTYVKGNKTTYKAKFTWTGKKIGKTSTISIYTKTNKNYGA